MEDRQLVDAVTDALKGAGYVAIEKRESSRSLTLSGHKGQRTVVVHFADPEPPAGPRSSRNVDIPKASAIVTRAKVPSIPGMSGSGGPPTTPQPRPRRQSSR